MALYDFDNVTLSECMKHQGLQETPKTAPCSWCSWCFLFFEERKERHAFMASKIPDTVKQKVEMIIQQFNKQLDYGYVSRYRGKYLYVDRKNAFSNATPVCRLTYTGDMKTWEFAIYKYSTERYDAEEWFFPGSSHVDGTIEGALKAGLEAYPS
jgi:hypothetical protein